MNCHKTILFIFLFTINFSSYSQGYKKISNEELDKVPRYSKEIPFGFSDDIPDAYSLEEFVPEIGDQKNSGSCVAWAFSYYGMSIIYNRIYDVKSEAGKNANKFDPYFIYNQIVYLEEDSCKGGIHVSELINFSKRYGNKKTFLSPTELSCESDWENVSLSNVIDYTKPYKFIGYEKIIPKNSNSIDQIQYELSNYKYPVMIGIENYGQGLAEIANDGIFKPNYIENNNDGHMMTIVGYDNNINGGSFRIVNSWGNDFGDNGYMWMSYEDYKKYTTQTYSVYVSFSNAVIDNTVLNTNNYIRKKFDNGDVYEGQYENGMINGKGIFSTNNEGEEIYVIGNWKNNVWDGFFKFIDSNNEIYEGIYENGVYVEDNSYGFNDDDDDDKKNKEKFLEYWEKYGGKKKIRKSRTIILKQKKVI